MHKTNERMAERLDKVARHCGCRTGTAAARPAATALHMAVASGDATVASADSKPTTFMSNRWIQTEVKQGTFGFQAGQPNPELIPIKEIAGALTKAVTDGDDPLMLQCTWS